MNLIAILIAIILCLSVFPTTVDAAEVWSDNFDDENLDGWTTFGFENITNGLPIDGNFSAEGGQLTALDDDINFARHDSTTSVGTWSFDMFVPDKLSADVGMVFMSNGSRPLEYETLSITIHAYTGENHFTIWELRGDDMVVFESPYIPTTGVLGWHHIDITRTDVGRFQVFVNDTIVWDFVSNDVTSSTYLELAAFNAAGAMFDNIVVSDTIDVTTTTTTTTTTTAAPIPLELIAIGAGVVILVLVIVYWIKK
ncbi:hypothetical protein EU528_07410 [Candidatus Thorarchaeota archaeon]|nr:MAG: hypothetical protein EU528_07410 [Candidatus Thorarchaeota archaeon]